MTAKKLCGRSVAESGFVCKALAFCLAAAVPFVGAAADSYWSRGSGDIAYFYSLLGTPEKTARLVRAICRDAYQARPDGLCGNDDCGQMSAWYLFSMMGFYPFNPCDDGYVVGAPQAEEMRLSLPGGKSLRIVARGLSEKAFCVTRLTLNSEEIKGARISHDLLMRGGELVFEMGEAR